MSPAFIGKVSVQFSRSVMSDSLRPHGLQHTRSPCPSPTPGIYSNSCPLSRWCHSTISSSVVPFSSFNLSWHQDLFKWVSSSIRWPKYWSFSFSISPSSEYSGLISFRMYWLISLQFKGLSRVSSRVTIYSLDVLLETFNECKTYLANTGRRALGWRDPPCKLQGLWGLWLVPALSMGGRGGHPTTPGFLPFLFT